MTRFYKDGSRSKRSLDDDRYGSEVPPGERSRYSPRGNDQDWNDRESSRSRQRAREIFSVREHEPAPDPLGAISRGGGMRSTDDRDRSLPAIDDGGAGPRTREVRAPRGRRQR